MEFCQEKKLHLHSGLRQVFPMDFALLKNESNSRIS